LGLRDLAGSALFWGIEVEFGGFVCVQNTPGTHRVSIALTIGRRPPGGKIRQRRHRLHGKGTAWKLWIYIKGIPSKATVTFLMVTPAGLQVLDCWW
jgi:hypothetical protein